MPDDAIGKEIMVETHSLVKVYGDGVEVRALDGVDLMVWRGEFVAIMGPSGCGKSTLLYLLGALDKPTSGEVKVNGQDLSNLRSLDHFRSQTVGFVFQLHNLIPTLTAVENVEVPMQERRLSPRARRQRAEQLLKMAGLEGRSHFLPNKLSGGERQKVAIARALANQPFLLLADEPTGNLDTRSGREIGELLDRLNREQHMTIILVTHNAEVARHANRIILMQDGRLASPAPA